MVAPNARGRAIAIDLKLATGLPAIRGDAVHLQQMLLNLMLNGMEALGQAPEDDRRILVRTAQAGDSGVELAISDTGPGIPPELLPRLFESFFTSKRSGMGLGLSIARSVVEAHGGRIRAENNPDRGATFRVSLPVVDSEVDPAPAV
jgi:two-component system, LuxR family, sensor kinase FixL